MGVAGPAVRHRAGCRARSHCVLGQELALGDAAAIAPSLSLFPLSESPPSEDPPIWEFKEVLLCHSGANVDRIPSVPS